MKESFYYEMGGEKHEYHVLENVSFSSLLAAIQDAVNMCYTGDGQFHPELIEFTKDVMILKTLTDIDVPDDVEGAYRVVRAIDGVRSVDADFIADGVYARIKYLQRMDIAMEQSSGMNRLADELSDMIGKATMLLDAGLNLIDTMASQTEGLDIAQMDAVVRALNKLDVGPKELAAIVKEVQKKPAKKAAKRVETE